ncbi:tetratricopeptide repeat protein [Candidatus Micrarchaeota archaeon]|nr:tetratricopeptide repeat protein [Candidatus Micrarchaeota archaeon]
MHKIMVRIVDDVHARTGKKDEWVGKKPAPEELRRIKGLNHLINELTYYILNGSAKGRGKAYYERANAERKLGHYERALDDYDKAVECGFDIARCLMERAELLKHMGRMEDAYEIVELLVNDHPNEYSFHFLKADLSIALAMKNWNLKTDEGLEPFAVRNYYLKTAINECIEGIATNPNGPEDSSNAQKYFIMGWAAYNLGELSDAKGYLRNAIQTNNYSDDTIVQAAYCALVEVYILEGNAAEACACAQMVEKLNMGTNVGWA